MPVAYRQRLYQRYRLVLGYTGLIGSIIGMVMLLPLVALLSYPEEWRLTWGFLLPGGVLIGIGACLWRSLARSHPAHLSLQDATVVVVLSWLLAIASGTIPFISLAGLTPTQAIFESTSGWTTTGLSVLSVEGAAHLILLFRSLTQLFGGAGFAIIALSALTGRSATLSAPELGAAEGRAEQLVPHVQRSAKWVMRLYGGYVLVGFMALRWAGMTRFDAINHAFSALSTGGFSTHAGSIGDWQSAQVEWVMMILMLLGSLNYVTSYLALKGRLQAVGRNSELRLQVVLVVAAGLLLLLGVTSARSPTLTSAIRTAGFATVTALSTTGFATINYQDWPGLGWFITIVLMMIGGQSGSTAGGLKLYRINVLLQSLYWEFKRYFLPEHQVTELSFWQGERRQFLSDRQALSVSLYLLLYLLVLMLGTGILTAYGYPLQASLFEYTSAISTVGLSVGITQPTAATGVLWAESVGMLLGRLEIMTALIGCIQICQDLRRLRTA